jgi:hypothetical protein
VYYILWEDLKESDQTFNCCRYNFQMQQLVEHFHHFKKGWMSVESDEYPGPTETMNWYIKYMILCKMSEHEISYSSCEAILTKDIGIRHVLVKFIPWLQWQSSRRKTTCLWLLSCIKLLKNEHNQWWNMGLQLWFQN